MMLADCFGLLHGARLRGCSNEAPRLMSLSGVIRARARSQPAERLDGGQLQARGQVRFDS
jgi:hypothetical protein